MALVRDGIEIGCHCGANLEHLVNLSCDVRTSYAFAVSPRYAGGAVEILDGAIWKPADSAWSGTTLTVRANVPVYKTLVLRIRAR